MPFQLIDVHGRPISDRDLSRAMRVNIAAGSLGLVWLAMTIMMPLTMFMEAVHASGVLIGLVSTVRFLVMAFQIPGAIFAEHLESRKKFWAPLVLAHRILWFPVALIAFFWIPDSRWMIWAVIAIVGLSDLLGNMATAPWFSWMADLIPVAGSGRFWGARQSIVTVASLAGMSLAGWILDMFRDSHGTAKTGFGGVFAISATFGVADIVVHLWVKEPRPVPLEKTATIVSRLVAPLKNRDFLRLTLALAAWNFGCALLGSFGIVYLKRDFPVTYSQIAALGVASLLGMACTSFIFGHWIDKIGARAFGAILFLVAPLTTLSWLFLKPSTVAVILPGFGLLHVPQAVVVQSFANFLSGSLFSAVSLCQMRLVPVLTQAHGRTMSMAVHWTLIGLLSALGPVTGGAIMDRVARHPLHYVLPTGTQFAFFHVLVGLFFATSWFVALPLQLGLPEKPRPLSA